MKSAQEIIQEYKLSLEKSYSPITVKNYISDIYHFVNWFASYFSKPFYFDLLENDAISAYKKSRGATNDSSDNALSKQSIERHLSSLRSFSTFLLQEHIITQNPFHVDETDAQNYDFWRILEFKSYLRNKNSSDLTIKYYINDILSFKNWSIETTGSAYTNSSPEKLFHEQILHEYKSRLLYVLQLSPLTINRKLSSIRNYANFLKLTRETNEVKNVSKDIDSDQNNISLEELLVENQNQSSSGMISSALQKPKNLYLKAEDRIAGSIASKIASSRSKSLFQPKSTDERINTIDAVLNSLKNKNIKKEFYAPHSVTLLHAPFHKKLIHHVRHTRPNWYKEYHKYPFVHYVHFGVLIVAMVAAGIFAYDIAMGNATADSYTKNISQNKILMFKGRILDKDNNPITAPTDITFALHNNASENVSFPLWEETQTKIQPSEDGSVSLTVGSKTPIPLNIMTSDVPLYLGVKIGDGPELSPRKPIGPAFAANTQTVQGMLPITNSSEAKNVLLALDSSGNLSIGGFANPTFQATGGDFTFSGETLILASNPSSNGNIVISPDGNGKIQLDKALISIAKGANFNIENLIEIEGGLGVNATSSAHAALIINQNSLGQLIAASTGGITKFVVDNQGIITRGLWEADIIGTSFGGLGSDITAAQAGEILYSISAKKYGTLRAGLAGQCLTAQGFAAPKWSDCGQLTHIQGTLLPSNTSLDFLIGGTATNSAKFAFINVNSGTPTLKIGSLLGLFANGVIQTYENTDLQLGSSTTKNILLASSGNVGINSLNPTRSLDISGTLGGNVELFIDGSGTRTVAISAKALVYDLEKETGTADDSGITTYSITGLPNIDGTIAYIYLKVSKGITPNPRTQTINLQINGIQIATVATPTQLLSSEEIKHMTAVRSNGIWRIQGAAGTSNTADLAEWTPYEGNPPQPGEIVSIGSEGKLVLSERAHDIRLAGVISTKPAITIGPQSNTSARLALTGRIPVIVTSIGGSIQSGDPITSSPIPGFGMKPQRNAPIIGKALSSLSNSPCVSIASYEEIVWPEDDGTNSNRPCFTIPVSSLSYAIQTKLALDFGLSTAETITIGKIMVLAHLSWSEADYFYDSLEVLISQSDETIQHTDQSLSTLMQNLQQKTYIAKVGEKAIDKTSAFSSITSAYLTGGLLTTKDAVVTGSLAAYNIVGNSISVLSADIETLTSRIITTENITSPIASISTLQTDTIEPLNTDVSVKLANESSRLAIKDADDNDVATIDNKGNISTEGTISGTNLAAQDIQTQNASISGTLRAQKIIAEDIDGLQNQVSQIASTFLQDYEVSSNIPGYMLGESVLAASVSASFGMFHHGLLSLGASTFGSLTAMDQIAIGSNFILSNSGINTIGTTLELQPLRQGAISLMAGSVTIDQTGKLIVSEDAVFGKNVSVQNTLFASTISHLPNQNLTIALDETSQLQVKNASSGAVLQINNTGNIIASGSGTFSKLNFSLVGQAIAGNDLEAYASGSAGTAIIKAYRPELTIYNNLVTNSSLIYVTPKNNTDNNVLYLLRQSPFVPSENNQGSFTIGTSQLIDHDVEFNWLIVN